MSSERTDQIDTHPRFWDFKQYLGKLCRNNNLTAIQWNPNRENGFFTLSGNASHRAGIREVEQQLTNEGYDTRIAETEETIILKLQASTALEHFASEKNKQPIGRG